MSFQILQEYYINITRKLQPGLPVSRARQDIRSLSSWKPIATDAYLLESAWLLADRYGFSWWDAQIVAAAQRTGCKLLLSEDMQQGMHVDGTLIVNPFAPDAPSPAPM